MLWRPPSSQLFRLSLLLLLLCCAPIPSTDIAVVVVFLLLGRTTPLAHSAQTLGQVNQGMGNANAGAGATSTIPEVVL